MSDKKITFIGAGNMAQAMVAGFIKKNYVKNNITCSNPTQEKLNKVKSTYGVKITENNIDACEEADIVFLAVKPQKLSHVCAEIKKAVHEKMPLVVSMASSTSINELRAMLGGYQNVLRIMPNTPCSIGLGAIGFYADNGIDDYSKKNLKNILALLGEIVCVDSEDQLNSTTVISGSGPAYVYLFMEALQQAAESLNLSPAVSNALIKQTALGAAALAANNDQSIQALRQAVTSPGGTTEQGVNTLLQGNLFDLIEAAVKVAKRKTKTEESS